MKDAKGAMSQCGAWWQPPERFRLAKGANEPFWCPIKKKPFVFDGAVARSHGSPMLTVGKGAMSPFGVCWPPPERFGVAKYGNEPFWCPIKKKPLFSMARWLDPWILNAKGAKDPKGAVGPFGGC